MSGTGSLPPSALQNEFLICEYLNVGPHRWGIRARACSEGRLSADSVEKHRVADAESGFEFSARAPFLSGFSRLLRCRKDLGQFAEVLGGCGEQEFVICATWSS